MSWETVRLDVLCQISSGGTPSRSKLSHFEGSISWAKISDIETAKGGYIYDTEEHISNEGLNDINNRIFPKGILLLAIYGSVGKIAFTGTEMSTNQAILGIKIKDENRLDYSYLKFWFQTIKGQLLDRAVGAALQNISLGIVKELQIPLPPLPIQKRIAEILDAADALKRKDQELLKKYDELAQAIFIDMFGDNVETIKLNDVSTKITDGVHAKPNYISEGVPFLSVKNVTKKFLDFNDIKYISLEDHQSYIRRCNPEFEDILYTKVGATYGRAAIVDKKIDFSIYVSLALIKPDRCKIYPFFLNFVMNSQFVKKQADRRIKGAGVPDLHLIEIKDFDIPFPTFERQLEFSKIIEKFNEVIANGKSNLLHSENLFNSIIQKAFKGELVA